MTFTIEHAILLSKAYWNETLEKDGAAIKAYIDFREQVTAALIVEAVNGNIDAVKKLENHGFRFDNYKGNKI